MPTPASPGTAQQTTITALTPGAPYAFRLRATVDNLTWSAPSNLVIASADPALDLTPPSAITDLTILWSSGDQFMVQWTPTGDDGPHGAATAYEFRSAATPLTPETWDAATPATSSPTPTGDHLQCLIDAPSAAAPLYVALRAIDDAGNRSHLSNVVSASPAGGRTWRVAADGSGDVPTIAAALAGAVHGDLVLVGPGRYTWTSQGGAMDPLSMIFIARDITGIVLASEAGPAATILDAERRGRVLFIQGNNDGVEVDGFTITNGVSPAADGEYPMAGGLVFHLTDVVIRRCVFTGNSGGQGGAIYFGGRGHPVIEDCLITGNTSTMYGGGVYLINCEDPVVRRCTITGNTTAGRGGGLTGVSVILRLEDSLIAGNHADTSGGGLAIFGYSNYEEFADAVAGDRLHDRRQRRAPRLGRAHRRHHRGGRDRAPRPDDHGELPDRLEHRRRRGRHGAGGPSRRLLLRPLRRRRARFLAGGDGDPRGQLPGGPAVLRRRGRRLPPGGRQPVRRRRRWLRPDRSAARGLRALTARTQRSCDSVTVAAGTTASSTAAASRAQAPEPANAATLPNRSQTRPKSVLAASAPHPTSRW